MKQPRGRPYTPAEDEIICAMRLAGAKLDAIAAALPDRTAKAAGMRSRRLGLPGRPRGFAKGMKPPPRPKPQPALDDGSHRYRPINANEDVIAAAFAGRRFEDQPGEAAWQSGLMPQRPDDLRRSMTGNSSAMMARGINARR